MSSPMGNFRSWSSKFNDYRASIVNANVRKYWGVLNPALRELSHNLLSSDDSMFDANQTWLYLYKTFTFKGEKYSGGKNIKERVTVLVGANMDGSKKLPLLMIGKSAKPKCFKSVRSLPVQYKSNKKPWMTSKLFENWLVTLDKILYSSNRKILLFIDNCTAHSKTPKLKCIKFVLTTDHS